MESSGELAFGIEDLTWEVLTDRTHPIEIPPEIPPEIPWSYPDAGYDEPIEAAEGYSAPIERDPIAELFPPMSTSDLPPDPDEVQKLLDECPGLADILRMAGRLSLASRAGGRRKVVGPGETMDVVLGSDVARLAPDALLLLADARFSTLTALDLAEGRARLLDQRIAERTHAGPIVVCVDVSGSMGIRHHPIRAPRWHGAAAIAIAFSRIAWKERRSATFLFFDTHITAEITVNRRSDPIDLARRIYVESAPKGLTAYAPVLSRAFDLALKGDADVIVVTDGDAQPLPAEFAAPAKRRGCRIFVISLSGSAGALEEIADHVAPFTIEGSEATIRERGRERPKTLSK